MPKRTLKEFETLISATISKFVPILLLNRHTFELKKGCGSSDSLMECVYNYPYLNVTISYSEKAYEDWLKGKDMVPIIVHEMCHPITDPFYAKAVSRYVSRDEILDERERLTDLICNIALKAVKRAKKAK